MATVNEKMTAIADAIRDKTGGTDALTLDDMVTSIPKVYNAGEQAEYDRFWDNLQDNGKRVDYTGAFSYFTLEIFNPKYKILKPKSAYYMFNRFNPRAQQDGMAASIDLVELLRERNITIDFSDCTDFTNWLLWAGINRIGVIDCKSLKNSFRCYYAYQLKTIDKLMLYEGNGTTFMWQGCSNLENITIEGPIEKAFDIHDTTKLTHDSLMSIINALKDLSGSGTSLVLTLGTTNLAKLTDSEKAIATQKGWTLA